MIKPACVTGKICHETQTDAENHVLSLKRAGDISGNLSIYYCSACAYLHVGHKAIEIVTEIVESVSITEPVKKKRGRPSKEEMEARRAGSTALTIREKMAVSSQLADEVAMAELSDIEGKPVKRPSIEREREAIVDAIPTIARLTKDLKAAAFHMSIREARYLVDTYYIYQDYRIRTEGQVRAMTQAGEMEPHEVLDWFMGEASNLEGHLKNVLGKFAEGRQTGRWALSITGIGPIISAGLIAYCSMELWRCRGTDEMKAAWKEEGRRCKKTDPCSIACVIERCNSAGRIWRYAGLDPTVKWQKGQLRPWNAKLKVLCWKAGQSFVKTQNRESDFYGKFVAARKKQEVERNEEGIFADQATRILQERNIGKSTDAYGWYSGCYEKGVMSEWLKLTTSDARAKFLKSVKAQPGTYVPKLPPGHIQARAERYAVKMFISHWHAVSFREAFGTIPPRPYILTRPEHNDYVEVPNYPFEGPQIEW